MRTPFLRLCLEKSASLADLLDAADRAIGRFVALSSHLRTLVALWVAHTHALDAFDVTPYLHVRSAVPGCGKTRLLEVLSFLVPKPWLVAQPSEAVLFRKIAQDMPVALLDESETALGPKAGPRGEALRGILDTGYRRGGSVPRVGENYVIEDFSTFCAKAFAGLRALPATLADRSIPVELRKRNPLKEPIERFNRRVGKRELAPLAKALRRWATEEVVEVLREARPVMPAALDDRTEEILEPLVAVADEAGGDWPARARAAAVAVCTARAQDADHGVLLLGAIREIFSAVTAERIFSTDLLAELVERDQEPWPRLWADGVGRAGTDGTPRRAMSALARRLKPFGIQSKTVRVGSKTAKGYERADFADTWERHLPPVTPPRVDPDVTPSQPLGHKGLSPLGGPLAETLATPRKPLGDKDCDVVTSPTAPEGVTPHWGRLDGRFEYLTPADRISARRRRLGWREAPAAGGRTGSQSGSVTGSLATSLARYRLTEEGAADEAAFYTWERQQEEPPNDLDDDDPGPEGDGEQEWEPADEEAPPGDLGEGDAPDDNWAASGRGRRAARRVPRRRR